MARLAAQPFQSAWLFIGPSGTGKTTMALALAEAIPAELHHIPSQECNLENIERVRRTCQYVPMAGKRMHLIVVDEAESDDGCCSGLAPEQTRFDQLSTKHDLRIHVQRFLAPRAKVSIAAECTGILQLRYRQGSRRIVRAGLGHGNRRFG